jgi:hypothetical protein
MTEIWTELWSLGTGRSRTYCGLAHTETGFAVDVFVGDTCIESHDHGTSTDAVRVAVALKDRYQHVSGTERVRMASFDFVLPPSRDQHSVSAM